MADDSKSHGIGTGPYKIPPTLYKGTRGKVFAAMREAEGKGPNAGKRSILLLQGGKEQYRYDTDHEPLFRQESNFLYLFGVNEPECYGALDITTTESLLFIPRNGPDYEVWCGRAPTPQQYKDKYGVDHVFFADEIKAVLEERGVEVIHTIYGLNTDSGHYSVETNFEGMDSFVVDKTVAHAVVTEARVIKTREEIDVLRYICELSSRAHVDVMQQARPGMQEYQLESIFRHSTQMKGGSRYLAYTCICGSGAHGATLHYGHAGAPNDGKVQQEHMLLLDMGAEYHGYCSDITCSYPADGRFTADQRIIYEAVLAATEAVYAELKPGVHWPDMHRAAEKAVIAHFVKHGLIEAHGKTLDELVALRLGAVFMPHGLGHFMGLDTHDVGGYPQGVERIDEPGLRCLRTARKLEAGMVLTVEPGAYFIDCLLDRALADDQLAPHLNRDTLRRFRGFGGVRLEDDVLITDTGYELLSQVPRTVEEVERTMAQGRE